MNEKIPFLFEAVNPEVLRAIGYAWEMNLPVLLRGETGTGKTSLVRALAKKYGVEFRRVNLNGSTTVDEFIGKIGLNEKGTYWSDGILTDAARKGHAILVDEINAARPEILFALHPLLDDDRMLILTDFNNEVVKPHPNFRFFAAMNPRDYAGTNEMNKAFISRFPVVIDVNYPPPDIELKIVKAHTEFADDEKIKELISFASEVRKAYEKEEINFIISPREIISACNLLHKGFSLKEALTLAILNKCEKEDKVAIQALIKLQFGFTDTWKQGKTLQEREKEIREAETRIKEMVKPFVDWYKAWENFNEKVKELKGVDESEKKNELLKEVELIKDELIVASEAAKDALSNLKFFEPLRIKERKKSKN